MGRGREVAGSVLAAVVALVVTFIEQIKTTDARICGSCGSVIEPGDTRAQPATALEPGRDEYPIRHAWTFVFPRTPTASKER
jgi:hypothetical protein